MDYSRIMAEAWRLTWRHRFLWVYGLFAGTGVGGGCNFGGGGGNGDFNLPSFDRPELRPWTYAGAERIGNWIVEHLALIVAAVAVAMVLGLVLIILHYMAKGALIAAVARLEGGQPISRSEGWAIGRRCAWRYLRLSVLALLVGIGVLVTLGIGSLVVVVLGQISTVLAVIVGILAGLTALVGLIALAIAFVTALSYAERAIAIDDLGARASLRRGIALLRLRFWPSIFVWLLSLVLGIVAAIALGILAFALLVPLGGAVVAAYLVDGLSGSTITVGAIAGFIFLLALWLASSVSNTYLSSFWTLAYLNATDRFLRPAAPGPDASC